jgi:4-amino-4-deoxy-L-arabinose transferase-like glycosyltransferase
METRRVALVLTLVALAYIVLGFNRGLSIYDEAIPVVAATRILDGDRPYRDFWVIYPPGQLYLLAVLFKVFGASLIVARLASVTAVFATSILTYGMARQLRLPVSLALLAAGLWTAAVGAIAGATLGAGILTALALGLASAAFLLRFRQEPRLTWLVMSGFALGVACLFRHDIGALLLLAEAVFIAGIMANRTHGDVIHVLRSLGLYLAVVSGPGVVAATLLLAYGVPAGDLVAALVIYPFTGYVAGRSLPLPPLIPDIGPLQAGRISIVQYAAGLRTGLRFYFPVVVLALVTAVLAIRRRALPAGDVWPVAFVTLIGLCLLPYAWVNSDLAHIVPAWAPTLLLFAWLLHQLPARGASRATGLALGVVWSLVFVWGALGAKTDALVGTLLGPSGLPLDPPRGAHIVAGLDAAPMQAAIRYVQSVVPPEERIFVGNARHDSLVLNDVMFYFLAGRRSGTRYHELVPGVATTVEVQTRIVQDLERHRVRYVVLRADPGYVPSPAGARTLDAFIQERFARTETFGHYSIWRRREQDRP